MNIEYQDCGAVAKVFITSTIFEFRKHNRVIDATLLLAPGTIVSRSGMFFMNSVISGKSINTLRAYKVALREATR